MEKFSYAMTDEEAIPAFKTGFMGQGGGKYCDSQ